MSFPNSEPECAPTIVRPAPPRRRGLLVAMLAVTALILIAAGIAVFLAASRPAAAPAAASTPTSNGIARPDPSCVTTTGSDHRDMWDANGWWAGRIDGQQREMAAFAVLSLKLSGRDVASAWICAPRPQG